MRKPGKIIRQVMDHLFKKPVTISYPREKSAMAEGFRGKLKVYADKCIGCKMCMRDCPANAIDIIKVADKKFKVEINLDKCIYCAQCVDSCLKKAIEYTGDYELAALDRKSLKVTFDAENKETPQG